MIELSSDRYARYLLHPYTRRLIAVVAGLLVAGKLLTVGWPWWAWVPATLLAVQLAYALLLLGVYGYQKSTYQLRARLMKQHLRQTEDDAETAKDSTQHLDC